jgi:hypothetical protein
MLNTLLLIVQTDLQSPELEAMRNKSKAAPSLWSGDTGLIIGAVLLVAAALFFWAFFVRKRPKQSHGSLVVERARAPGKEAHAADGRRRRRKKRPEHPDNWGRNPTLEETGGLPPARPDEPEVPPQDEPAEPLR